MQTYFLHDQSHWMSLFNSPYSQFGRIYKFESGVMIPIPQYPIYSATIDLLGGQKVGYFLDEERGWDMNLEELERSLLDAREKGINVNSFVLINPGNPTGQVLSKKAVRVSLSY